MSDVSFRGRRRPPIPTRSEPSAPSAAPIAEGELTAEVVFRIPTVAEVVKAGYPKERLEAIRAEALEYRKRFNSDPEFRAFAIEQYKKWQTSKTTLP